MIKFLKSLLTSSIITSIAFIVIGAAFIFAPAEVLTILANTIAVMLLIYGVYGLILTSQSISVSYSLNIGTSIIALVLGVVLLMNNDILKAIIPVVLGIFFVINSIAKLRYSLILKERKAAWLAPMLISFLLMFCGVLMLAHPVFSAIAITTFIGVLMIVYAVIDLIDAAFLGKELAHVENYLKGKGNKSRTRQSTHFDAQEAEVVDKKSRK